MTDRRLWIMRHGEADWQAESDVERALTQRGKAQASSVAKRLDISGNLSLWVSPYRRAQETATSVMSVIGDQVDQEITESLLVPEAEPAMLASLINASDDSQLLLVSHMPIVARLLFELTNDDRIGGFSTAQIVECKKSNESDTWQLVAVYSPES